MKTTDAIKQLEAMDKQNRCVFKRNDLAKLFRQTSNDALNRTITRLVQGGILERVCYGIYVYALSDHRGDDMLQRIALTIRRGSFMYESLESALSRWGVISQIPVDRLTCMTSGRSLEALTNYGVIEFVHTKKDASLLIQQLVYGDNSLVPLADPELAVRDLRRAGRNTDLIDLDAYAAILNEREFVKE